MWCISSALLSLFVLITLSLLPFFTFDRVSQDVGLLNEPSYKTKYGLLYLEINYS